MARRRRESFQRRRKRTRALTAFAAVVLIALVGVVLLSRGSNESEGSNQPVTLDAPQFSGGPRMAVDRTEIDHGNVPYGYEAQASYRVKNVGDQLLRIEAPEVKTLEGC